MYRSFLLYLLGKFLTNSNFLPVKLLTSWISYQLNLLPTKPFTSQAFNNDKLITNWISYQLNFLPIQTSYQSRFLSLDWLLTSWTSYQLNLLSIKFLTYQASNPVKLLTSEVYPCQTSYHSNFLSYKLLTSWTFTHQDFYQLSNFYQSSF